MRIESTKTIDIDSFVPADDIDRLYWDNPYYLVPDGKMAAEPFAVIREAMEKSGKVAIARLVMSQRERVVALEARDNGIVATMLRSHDEVRSYKAIFDDIPEREADKDMIAIAQRIIEQKAMDFDPTEFDDRYQDALRAMIEEKQKGHEISRPKEEKDTCNVVDLMTALRQSLDAKDKEEKAPRKTAAKSTGTAKRAVDKPAAPKKEKSA